MTKIRYNWFNLPSTTDPATLVESAADSTELCDGEDSVRKISPEQARAYEVSNGVYTKSYELDGTMNLELEYEVVVK